LSIAFTGASPSEARDVTAKLAEVLIRQDSDIRKKQAILVRDFLETEKRTTEDGLRGAELALASFMAAHPRFALDATPLATGAAIRATLGAGSVQPAPLQGGPRWRVSVGSRDGTGAGSEPATNPTSARVWGGGGEAAVAEQAQARAALVVARANLAELSSRFTAAHPDVRAAQAEVERATSRLAAASAVLGSAANQSPTSGSSSPAAAGAPMPRPSPGPVADLRPVVERTGGAVVSASVSRGSQGPESDVVALETEWVKLTRAASEARQHHDQVEAALFKARSAADSEVGAHGAQVTMIDPAFLPQSAVPPGRATIAVLFAGISLLLATVGAALKALLNDRIYEERDIRPFAPVLVEVPRRAHAS
jgi:uncharacterized protein involved in exopolysaccharide biosynthesis